ncbi:hypothetical protein ACKWTF_016903 [Chironomus riparius]
MMGKSWSIHKTLIVRCEYNPHWATTRYTSLGENFVLFICVREVEVKEGKIFSIRYKSEPSSTWDVLEIVVLKTEIPNFPLAVASMKTRLYHNDISSEVKK